MRQPVEHSGRDGGGVTDHAGPVGDPDVGVTMVLDLMQRRDPSRGGAVFSAGVTWLAPPLQPPAP